MLWPYPRERHAEPPPHPPPPKVANFFWPKKRMTEFFFLQISVLNALRRGKYKIDHISKTKNRTKKFIDNVYLKRCAMRLEFLYT